ncbi:MAG: 4-hydroxy-tetrahydrodipicolinate reductase, partial [Nitrospinae bacterium]|nr:4-hydroxy-tetrahydrodipicolinate reductase [Nitrospinota bacterium]
MTVKIIVTGCCGRMGRAIVNAIERTDGVTLAGGTEREGSPFVGIDVGEATGVGRKGFAIASRLADIIDTADVVIDFSVPAASLEHFLLAAERGKGLVVGTTGFDPEHWKTFESMATAGRTVIAPNMSVGVNVLFKLARDAAKLLSDYDVEIVEMHHNQKMDAPSGTAVKLADVVADALGRKMVEVGKYGRYGVEGKRPRNEIGVMTLRGGDVVGDHTLIFAGTGERVELSHKAGSRD